MKKIVTASCLSLVLVLFAGMASGQSSDQQFPTPVRSSEIGAVIKPRDIGDSRSTTHYYTFEGEQGDLFINVQTRNFTGDIDVFVVQGLRPLTKIVLYADIPETETGRVIYLRKPETILLRVQGRTPGDDDASYRIKFAGSFAVSKATGDGADSAPTVADRRPEDARVNSVGTLIPRPTPEPAVKSSEPGDSSGAVVERRKEESESKNAGSGDTAKIEEERSAPRVVITDPLLSEAEKVTARKTARPQKTPVVRRPKSESPAKPRPEPQAPAPDPMAGLNLTIRLKDGSTIERQMTTIYRFTVERAILTVINKDGKISRYNMIEVASVTIEPEQ